MYIQNSICQNCQLFATLSLTLSKKSERENTQETPRGGQLTCLPRGINGHLEAGRRTVGKFREFSPVIRHHRLPRRWPPRIRVMLIAISRIQQQLSNGAWTATWRQNARLWKNLENSPGNPTSPPTAVVVYR